MKSAKRQNSHDANSRNTFRFAPFEHYMLADDSAEYPMSFWVKLTFEGKLDQQSFRDSFVHVIDRHPLLNTRVAGDTNGRTSSLKWHLITRDDERVFWFHDVDQFANEVTRPIDLSQEAGLRVCVFEDTDKTVVSFHAHHACTDAAGVLQVIDELLIQYDQGKAASAGDVAQVGLPDLEQQLLDRRITLGLSRFEWARRLPKDLRRLANFFRGKAEPISEPIGVNAESVSVVGELHPDCLFASLDEQTVKGLVKRSRESSEFTVNDFLLDALFQSLATWNQENDPNGDRSIRIGMATDMRDPDDEWLPAANKVSMVFLTQQTNLHPDRRLETLNHETTAIKKNNMGLTLCRVLNWVGRIPGGMRRLLSKRDCFSTAILSNLGIVLERIEASQQSSDARFPRIANVALIPPIRRGTGLVFGVATFCGKMHIAMQFDSKSIDRSTAATILTHFEKRIRLKTNDLVA